MWNPRFANYVEYVPIGGLFGAFLWDRSFPSCSAGRRHAICDLATTTLALMRVFVPPLPFVSGHVLFASYGVLTARTWAFRAIAVVVLAQVVYVKLLVTPGLWSMLGGFAVAAVLGRIRARRAPGAESSDAG
jgi:hypothetical protein